ncbi:MAG: hypothetical protein WAM17_07840, partial [Rhodoplanes sp.]
ERFEIRPLIVGHPSANQGRSPQRAALNQFAIPASMSLSTRPSLFLAHKLFVRDDLQASGGTIEHLHRFDIRNTEVNWSAAEVVDCQCENRAITGGELSRRRPRDDN